MNPASSSQNFRGLAFESIAFCPFWTKHRLENNYSIIDQGAIQVLRNAFFWRFRHPPPPRNTNNVDTYIFVTFLFKEI